MDLELPLTQAVELASGLVWRTQSPPCSTAPNLSFRCPLHSTAPHLQPLGVHSLAKLGCRSHKLTATRGDYSELLQSTAQGCAQAGAGLLPVGAALHRGCTEGLHRVGTAKTEGDELLGREGWYKCGAAFSMESLGLLDSCPCMPQSSSHRVLPPHLTPSWT